MKITYRFSNRNFFSKLFLTLIACGIMGTASAQNIIMVTNGGDQPGHSTLRDAVLAAANGDTIKFSSTVHSVTLMTGPIIINKDVTIDGYNSATSVSVNGRNSQNIFVVDNSANAKLTLKNITLTNGSTGDIGGAIKNQGSAYLYNVSIVDCRATADGGAIHNAGFFYAENCTFYQNDAGRGGAIFTGLNTTDTAIVMNSSIIGNGTNSRGGSAIAINEGCLLVANSTVSNNGSNTANAAAIFQYGGATDFCNSIVTGNICRSNIKDYWMNGPYTNIAHHTLFGSANSIGSNIQRDVRSQPSSSLNSMSNIFINGGEDYAPIIKGVTHHTFKIQRNSNAGRYGVLLSLYVVGGVQSFAYQDRDDNWQWKDFYTNTPITVAPARIYDQDEIDTSRTYMYTRYPGQNRYSFGALAVQPEAPSNIVDTTSDIVDHYDYKISLREALEYIASGLTSQSYVGFKSGLGDVVVDNTITFDYARELRGTASIKSVPGKRIFNVVAGGALTLDRITLKDANLASGNGGAIRLTGGSLIARNSTFNNNQVNGRGGAISNEGGLLSLYNVVFTNNKANGDWGGAIYTTGASGSNYNTINKATFLGNQGTQGGAIYSGTDQLEVSNSTFTQNNATFGGALCLNGGTFLIESNTIVNNTCTSNGGGLYFNNGNGSVLNTILLSNNSTDLYVADASQFNFHYNYYHTTGGSAFSGNGNVDYQDGLNALFNNVGGLLKSKSISGATHRYYDLLQDVDAATDGAKTAKSNTGTHSYAYWNVNQWVSADGSPANWVTTAYVNSTDQIDQTRLEYDESSAYSVGAVAIGSYTEYDTIIRCDDYTVTLPSGLERTWINTVMDTMVVDTMMIYTSTTSSFTRTIYLNLTLYRSVTVTDSIVACNEYTWDLGNGLTTYYDAEAQDTMFFFTENYCDSLRVLVLSMNYKDSTDITEVQCDSYIWQVDNPHDGTSHIVDTFLVSGDYLDTTSTVAGCDSIVVLHLTINYSDTTRLTEHACDQYSWHTFSPFGGGDDRLYVSAMDTLDTVYMANQYGCDSVVTLALVVDTTTHSAFDTVVCNAFRWQQENLVHAIIHDSTYQYQLAEAVNGTTFTVLDSAIFPNVKQCDSIRYMNLTLHRSSMRYSDQYDYAGDTSAVACDIFTWYGNTYTASTDAYATSHTLFDANSWGCDSVVYLNLTVNYQSAGTDEQVVCDTLTWIDGNGYNVSTNTPTYTLANANSVHCDSVVTLHLTVNYSNSGTEDTTVCDRFVWSYGDGNEYTMSNHTATWHYTNAVNCDSTVTLNLTVNYKNTGTNIVEACDSYTWNNITYTASNLGALDTMPNQWGCDSIITLNLTMRYSSHGSDYETACDSYTWKPWGDAMTSHIFTYTTDTVINDTIPTVFHCDSVKTLHLTLTGEQRKLIIDTCDNYTWAWNGSSYTVSGNYSFIPTGCTLADSLFLTIRNSSSANFNEVKCDSYDWFGIRTSTGTYKDTIPNAVGCDSLMTLNLVINASNHTDTAASICDQFTWHGNTYNASGICHDTLTNQANCDSTITLALTIRNSSSATFNESACDSYTWFGTDYTANGAYDHAIPNHVNCDSNMTLNLAIHHPTHNVTIETACDSYTWAINGHTYTASGTYIYEYNNNYGCASVDTLKLTIYNSEQMAYSMGPVCDSYTWPLNSQTYTASGTYTNVYPIHDGVCNHTDTLHLAIKYSSHNVTNATVCDSYTWNVQGASYTKTTSGTYPHLYNNVLGCPSADTLHLTVNYSNSGNENRSVCDSYTWQGTTYTASAVDQRTLTNVSGCDSVATLNLTVYYNTNTAYHDSACGSLNWNNNGNYVSCPTTGTYYSYYNESVHHCPSVDTMYFVSFSIHGRTDTVACDQIDFHGHIFTEPVHYVYLYMTPVLNCQNSDTLNLLAVNHSSSSGFSTTECGGYTWLGNDYTATGTYTDTLVNHENCDSVITMHLTVNPITHNRISASACDSYTWHGTTYTNSGTYTYSYTNNFNCTSMDTLFLSVRRSSASDTSAMECDNFTWRGNQYTASGNYNKVYTNAVGCDSTRTLHLTIINSPASDTTAQACETFTWNNVTYTNTPQVNPTRHYDVGQFCDSIVTLHLTVYHNEDTHDSVTACDSYTWHGTTYTSEGTYYHNYTYAACENHDTLELKLRQSSHNKYTEVACDSYTWTLNSNSATYTATGTYTMAYTNSQNCPSTDTLALTVNYSEHGYLDTIVCDSLTWHNVTYTATSDDPIVFHSTTAQGCPITDTLQLGVRLSTHSVEHSPVCDYYIWHGTQYNQSGIYTYDYLNGVGCPSTDTLHLDVHQLTRTSQTLEVCEGYTWRDTMRVVSGLYAYTYFDEIGCFSYDTLYLTVKHGSHDNYTDTSCNSYIWTRGNGTYTASGTYTYAYTNIESCPSVDTLRLHIDYSTSHTETMDECDYYLWHGVIYEQPGTYYYDYSTSAGCVSKDTLQLAIRHSSTYTDVESVCDSLVWIDGHTYSTNNHNATYTIFNHEMCDSTITLNLTVNHSFHETQNLSACDSLLWIDGEKYWTDTVVDYHLLTVANCDSVYTLKLTLTTDGRYHDTADVCDSYIWNGDTYTTTGLYTFLQEGCSRRDTLHLTVRHSTAGDTIASVCDNLQWFGHNYTASGLYTHTLPQANMVACDSVVNLNLTVRHSSTYDTAATFCDQFVWHGNTYTESTVATDLLTNSQNCDSTITLILTIHGTTTKDVTETACDSYTWRGITYDATPIAPVVDTIVNTMGCDSIITLNLTIHYSATGDTTVVACNAWGWYGETYTSTLDTTRMFHTDFGCDSLVTLHLSINYRTDTLYTVNTCDSYTWNGNTYTASGTYFYNYDNSHGCTGTDTLVLTLRQSTHNSNQVNACDSYVWNEHTYTETGDYINTYLNTDGCMSADTLHLKINEGTNLNIEHVACESYTWHDSTMTATGIMTYSYINAVGCASTDTLHLTINHGSDSTWNVVACDSYTWTRNSITYTDTTNVSADYLNNVGCPSHDSLILVVKYSTHDTSYANVCDSYTWHGTAYTTTGNKTYNYTNGVGCPSTDTLHLTIRNASHSDTTVTACDSFTWWRNNVSYTTSGLKRYTYTNSVNCPSADTLHLTIGHSTHNVSTESVCDSYTWHGTSYTTSGNKTYTYTNSANCPSADTLHLTIRHSTSSDTTAVACDSFTWNATGLTYTVSDNPVATLLNSQDCDSTRTLHLTIHYSHPYTQTLVVCDSLKWMDGNVYTVSTDEPTHMLQTTHNCDSLVSLNLTVNYSAEVHIYDSICEGDSYTFGGMAYTEGGDYPYSLQTMYGCDSTTVLHLTKLVHPTISFHEQHSCTTFDYYLTPNVLPSTNYNYTWTSNPTDPFIADQVNNHYLHITPVEQTTYSVTVDYVGNHSCPSTKDTTLVKIVQPHAHMIISPEFMTYENHQFEAVCQSTDFLTRKWFIDGSYYTNAQSFVYQAMLDSDTTHVMLAVNTETCGDTIYKDIPIKKSILYIPNVFTPGEITNNIFRVMGHGITQFEIYIYNRSGLLVYHSTDMNEGWDGTHNGRACPQSAYVYLIKYSTVDIPRGTQLQKGTITLLR